MDKGKTNDGAAAGARDPSLATSGDPRRNNPLGGGTASGPRPEPAGSERHTGDRNARDAFKEAPDRRTSGTKEAAP